MATCMKRTSITIPFPNMCKKGCMNLNVEYCIIDQSCVFDKERKGGNSISSKELQESFLYAGEKSGINLHVTIILGRFTSSKLCADNAEPELALLLLRFHTKQWKYNHGFSNAAVEDLYRDVSRITNKSKQGYELLRSGGSAGPIILNPVFFAWLGSEKSFPRKARGVKIVLDYKNAKYHCFYLPRVKDDGSSANVFVSFRYHQPQVGGNFELPPCLLHTRKKLQSFVLSKPKAANVLHALGKLTKLSIATEAVANELEHLRLSEGGPNSMVPYLCNGFVKWTMNVYAASFHIDQFHEGRASLENRMAFRIKRPNCTDIGRGGSGSGWFCFILLDWTGNTRKRKTLYVAVETAIAPHRAVEINQLKLTDRRYREWFALRAADPTYTAILNKDERLIPNNFN